MSGGATLAPEKNEDGIGLTSFVETVSGSLCRGRGMGVKSLQNELGRGHGHDDSLA